MIALLLAASLLGQAKDAPSLIGEWRIVAVEGDGPAKLLKDNIKSLAIDAATITAGRTAKYTADLAKKTIDLVIDGGPKAEQGKYLGVLELKGNDLKLCFAAAGKDRPKTLDAKDGAFVISLKRK